MRGHRVGSWRARGAESGPRAGTPPGGHLHLPGSPWSSQCRASALRPWAPTAGSTDCLHDTELWTWGLRSAPPPVTCSYTTGQHYRSFWNPPSAPHRTEGRVAVRSPSGLLRIPVGLLVEREARRVPPPSRWSGGPASGTSRRLGGLLEGCSCMSVHACAYACVYTYPCGYVHLCTYMCVGTCKCVCMHVHVGMCVCM